MKPPPNHLFQIRVVLVCVTLLVIAYAIAMLFAEWLLINLT